MSISRGLTEARSKITLIPSSSFLTMNTQEFAQIVTDYANSYGKFISDFVPAGQRTEALERLLEILSEGRRIQSLIHDTSVTLEK